MLRTSPSKINPHVPSSQQTLLINPFKIKSKRKNSQQAEQESQHPAAGQETEEIVVRYRYKSRDGAITR